MLCAALGVGAVGASFSLVESVLLRPLPYPEAGRLVMVWERALDGSAEQIVCSWANFLDWRARSRSFDRFAAFNVWFPTVTGMDRPERLLGAEVTPEFFQALGARPALGRLFLAEEGQPGRDDVVVLSHGLWHRRFGGDPKVLGRRIELDGAPHTVVGVLPQDFRHPEPLYFDETTELWRPLAFEAGSVTRGSRFLRTVARLAPGITRDAAQSEMDGIARQMEREHPAENEGLGVQVVPLHEQVVGEVRPALRIAFAASFLVLLIACANISGLLLAAAIGRSRETAVRAALGAGRGRLAIPRLLDALLLTLAGGAAGLAVASPAVSRLLARSPKAFPRAEEVGIDGRVLAVALGACVLAAMLAALTPALRTARSRPAEVLQEGSPGAGSGRGGRLLALLVVLETALALPLLAGTGLLAKSLAGLSRVPLGFTAEDLLTLRLELPAGTYPEAADRRAFAERLLERVAALPGVRSAGLTSSLPLSGLYDISREAFLDPPPPTGPPSLPAGYRSVSPGYFPALGIPLLAGRPFGPEDGPDAPDVALVNRAFARAAWGDASPLGRKVVLRSTSGDVTREVVGMVGDVRHEGPAVEPRPELFVPQSQTPTRFAVLVVRAGGRTEALASALRNAMREIDPDLPAEVRPMAELTHAATAGPRFQLLIAGLLGTAAVILVAAGIGGVTAYSTARRTREIGIRMALGAGRREILLLVLRRALGLTLAGTVLGLASARVLTRGIASMLFGIEPADPATLAAAALLLLLVGLAAGWVPARRALQVDPAAALRSE